ncbi:MAG: hypothetical protein DRN15_08415 [Thermoprotei archaeon]|nr:MAG: hypothetical protein DRM97_07570 [Thermoprotei archaeon]RLF22690.1 MAG: hypothetical protein DRN15_08415 [Thermoprotei archaeon]
MCRIVAIKATSKALDRVEKLLTSLERASAYDPFLASLTKGKLNSHSDGWGVFVIGVNRCHVKQYISSHLMKSNKPFASSKPINTIMDLLSDYEEFILIVHVRAAGRNEPKSIIAAHPFIVPISTKELYVFCHNGSVNKSMLVKELKMEDLVGIYPDSYFSAVKIVKEAYNIGLEEAIRKVMNEYTRTAFNTASVHLGTNQAVLYVTTYYKKRSEDFARYYSTYLIKWKEGIAYVSSTVLSYYDVTDESVEAMSNGDLRKWRIIWS